MKVVLRQDVDNLGERGQVVNVAAGYARNYLLPKKLALEATAGNLRTLELHKRSWAAREVREVADAQTLATRLAGVQVTVTKKAGESDTLYGSVTTAEIADLLAKAGYEVDRRKIQMVDPIKTLGSHTVQVKIHRQVLAPVTVLVVAEGE
jgi:large subunit ribosomal protein L9